jgi:hypothetical protein
MLTLPPPPFGQGAEIAGILQPGGAEIKAFFPGAIWFSESLECAPGQLRPEAFEHWRWI